LSFTIIVSIVFFNKIKIFKHYVKLISEPHSPVFYAPADIKFVVELFAVFSSPVIFVKHEIR